MIRAAAILAGAALAVQAARRPRVLRIQRVSRVVADLDRAVAFYQDALDFRVLSVGALDLTIASVLGAGPAREAVLQLGGQQISLVRFEAPGAPYPAGSRSNDAWFQHLAIVVSDIDAAYAHLTRHAGWAPISQDGPVTLPPANGSVRAFKFRDTDGHPLELIWFPAGPAAGGGLFTRIDHSALAVRDAARSAGFYRALGFHVAARSLNQGEAQDRLDRLPHAVARITSLRPPAPDSAGLELLGYRPPGRPAPLGWPQDRVTDWVTMIVDGSGQARALRDPDGHRMVLLSAGNSPPPAA
jgi:catechol 2,3-dioxygenase-like lactoylglutathione lyase family enzyme